MPKNHKEEIIFSIIMVLFMVYVMVFYNVVLKTGLNYNAFLITLKELPMVALIAWLVEHFFVGKTVKKIAFKTIDIKKSESIIIILMISTLTVMFMCPIMSLIATIIHNHNNLKDIPLLFIKSFALNLPVALLAQILYVGPIVRMIFKKIKNFI